MYKSIYKKNWITLKLEEDLRLSDLKKHSGISDFTKRWKDERQGIKGAGNTSAKLIRMKVNRNKDYITFVFYSSPTYDLAARVVKPDSNFKLNGEKPFYTQEIRILDFFKWAETTPNYDEKSLTNEDVKEILNSASIQVFCNDPSFHWQGDNYIISQFNASIHPTSIAPKRWNQYHNDDNFVCKHLSLLLNSIDFWLNPMTSMLNKYLKNS